MGILGSLEYESPVYFYPVLGNIKNNLKTLSALSENCFSGIEQWYYLSCPTNKLLV